MINCKGCGVLKGPECFYWRKGGTLQMRLCKDCWRDRYYPEARREQIKTRVTERKREKFERVLLIFDCEWCKTQIVRTVGRNGRSRFCSRACKDATRRAAQKAARIASKPKRFCVRCGVGLSETMRADAKFCSMACNNAAHSQTKNFRRRKGDGKTGPLISLAWIAKRSNWRCGLCGGEVDRKKRHPDPLCASVDHIVPLALGGTNEVSNLQLAHLRCNLRKRAVV